MTITDSRPAILSPPPNVEAPDAASTRPTTQGSVPDVDASGGPVSPAAKQLPPTMLATPQGPTSGRHVPSDTRGTGAAGVTSPAAAPVVTPEAPSPQGTTTTGSHVAGDTQVRSAAGSDVPGPAAEEVAASIEPTLLDPALSLAADILDDLERVRIANENRLRQLTRSEIDKDGEERGFGLDESHPDVARLAAMVNTLKALYHDAELNLGRKMRKHPLGPWVKTQKGVGEKQGARLLVAIGDPYINSAKGTPRTVSALWAYAGLHVLPVGQIELDAQAETADRNQPPAGRPALGTQSTSAGGDQRRDTDHSTRVYQQGPVGVAAKRRKGERANWSGTAKMRAYLVAESCVKQLSPDCRDGHPTADAQRADAQSTRDVAACACSPYRMVYDARRTHTARSHPEWTDGHSHNDGLRVASKAILRDLWRAARDWHLANGAKS